MRELGKRPKVDADTLFMIASNTKALTTLMLAKLVDEGKLTWDTPVTGALAVVQARQTPTTTAQVLVKHLICACTGLPRQDFEWLFEFEGVTPEGALATLGTMQPTSKFGEMFQYSNPLAGGRRLHRRARGLPRARARRRLRPGDADAGVRPARHDGDDLRLRRARWRATTPCRTRPTSTASRRSR